MGLYKRKDSRFWWMGLHGERRTTVRVDQNLQQRTRKEDMEEMRSRDRAGRFQVG